MSPDVIGGMACILHRALFADAQSISQRQKKQNTTTTVKSVWTAEAGTSAEMGV